MQKYRRDLAFRLLALYIIFVAPVVIASLTFDQLASRRQEAEVKAADLALARAVAQQTNGILQNALESVSRLGTYPEVLKSDVPGMQALFRLFVAARPDVNLVYRLDARGVMVYHYPEGQNSTVGTDFSFREYYRRALAAEGALFSEGRISPTTQAAVASAVMPLQDSNGRFIGIVAANIKLQSISSALAAISAEQPAGNTLMVMLVDNTGKIIAHPDPQELLIDLKPRLPEVIRSVLGGQFGSVIAQDGQGREMLFSIAPIPSSGWGVILGRPTAEAFATPIDTHRGVLIVVAVFLIVGVWFWLALSNTVLEPIEKIAAYSQSIAAGAPLPAGERSSLTRIAARPDQIGHLVRSLTQMDQAIDARLKELSTLLETSAAVVSSLDSRILLNRILEQVQRLMEIDKCAIVAWDERRGVFRAQAIQGLSERYGEQLAILPGESQSVTITAIRTGQPYQVEDTDLETNTPGMQERARQEGYRAVLAVPLTTQHAPPAALVVYRPEPHTFNPREITLLTSFANHAAMAIENAALFARSDARLAEQTRRLEALIQSLQEGLILENLSGQVIYANRNIAEIVNIPLDEINKSAARMVLERLLFMVEAGDGQPLEKIRSDIEAAWLGQGPDEVEFSTRTGVQRRDYLLQGFEVTDADGALFGRGQILRDITQSREVDRMKSGLISTVSHELRTPLAAIKGYVSTLLAEDVSWDPASQHEFLSVISHETDRLSELVTNLLDMSRFEAGSLKLALREARLEDLIGQAARRAHPGAAARLRTALPANLPPVCVDSQRMEVVLRNLIENAAKYSDENTPIQVSAAVNSRFLQVRVEDEGPGIPSEHQARIFDSFYRVESSLSPQTTGAGLGLAICQAFIQAHGGHIWLEPRPRGACIAFSIPLDSDPDPHPTPAPARRQPQP